jgi:hypothetical protein
MTVTDTFNQNATRHGIAVQREVTSDGYNLDILNMYKRGELSYLNGDSLPATTVFRLPYTAWGDGIYNFEMSPDEQFAYLTGDDCVQRIDLSAGTYTVFAGDPNNYGFADGIGGAAQMQSPFDLRFGPDGFLYLADTYNNAIRKVNVDTAEVTTFHEGISSAKLYWRNGNLYRDDWYDGGIWVHFKEDLANPLLCNPTESTFYGDSIAVSSNGIVYNSAEFGGVVALETKDRGFHQGDEFGQIKIYSRRPGFQFRYGDSIDIKDDGNDNLFAGVGSGPRRSSSSLNSQSRVLSSTVPVVRVQTPQLPSVKRPPQGGTNLVDTIYSDPSANVNMHDIEYAHDGLWISGSFLGNTGVWRLPIEPPFVLEFLAPLLGPLSMYVADNQDMFALATSRSGGQLNRVALDGSVTLVGTIPGGVQAADNGLTFDGSSWWAVVQGPVNNDPYVNPPRIIEIPLSGASVVHTLDPFTNQAGTFFTLPSGVRTGWCSIGGMAFYDGDLITHEGSSDGLWRINRDTFVMSQFNAMAWDGYEPGRQSSDGTLADFTFGESALGTGIFRSQVAEDDSLYTTSSLNVVRLSIPEDRVRVVCGVAADGGTSGRQLGPDSTGYDGLALAARFGFSTECTMDLDGNIYIIDTTYGVRRFKPGNAIARLMSANTANSVRVGVA